MPLSPQESNTAGKCKEFIGIENHKAEYTTRVCSYNSALDIYMKRISEDSEDAVDSKTDEYMVTGDLSPSRSLVLENLLYFDQVTVEGIKSALKAYASCLTKSIKLDTSSCKLPEGIDSDKTKQKKITVTIEEVNGKYTVKSFKIKSVSSRRRRSCTDKKKQETCVDDGIFNETQPIKINLKKSFSGVMSNLRSITKSSKVRKLNIKVAGKNAIKQSTRSRRDVEWLSMESYLREQRVPKSLDVLVDSLSAMTQAHML